LVSTLDPAAQFFLLPVPSGLFPLGHAPKVRPYRRAGYGFDQDYFGGKLSIPAMSLSLSMNSNRLPR
jgi:hypothetical protein